MLMIIRTQIKIDFSSITVGVFKTIKVTQINVGNLLLIKKKDV